MPFIGEDWIFVTRPTFPIVMNADQPDISNLGPGAKPPIINPPPGFIPPGGGAPFRSDAGFGDTEIVEIVAHVALNTFTNTFNRLARTPIDFPKVELQRYLGTWFEIATIPQFFQKACHATTATYSLRDDGDILVVNQCNVDGEPSRAEGKGWVVDDSTNLMLA